jgi:hypothetical protein
VQLDTAHELHVVVDHVPLELLAGHHHLGTNQSTSALAHRGERLGENLVEDLGDRLAQLRLDAAATVRATQLVVDALPLDGVARRPLRDLEARNLFLELVGALVDDRAKLRGLPSELLLGDSLQPSVMLIDLVDDRLNPSSLALVAGPEDLAQYAFQHAFLYRYSPCEPMYSATASVTNP